MRENLLLIDGVRAAATDKDEHFKRPPPSITILELNLREYKQGT